jgi:hypothetical protein
MIRRDPACPCINCNPPAPRWSERWFVIVAAWGLYLVLIAWLWN